MSGNTTSLATVTSTDHRGWLWITVITCTIVCPILLLGRGIVRHKKYGLDDLAVMVSFVFVMAHAALLMGSLEFGFGVQLTPSTQAGILEASKLVFASRILLSLILTTSKISALLLIRRLLPQNYIRLYICNIGIVIVVLWGVATILIMDTSCIPSHMLLANKESSCSNLDIRISVAMAMSCAIEAAVLGLAAMFLRPMQVNKNEKKWVAMGFLLRVPNIALTITYLIFYLRFLSSGSSSISFIPVAIIQQFIATYTFFASVSPAFLPFTIPYPSIFFFNNSSGKLARRISTPMSFFGDKIKGDREVFTHRARVFADVGGVQRRESEKRVRLQRQKERVGKGKSGHKGTESMESLKGIVREETFEVQVL
ncbi:hypothetical protein E4T44_07455 [Aureobasidium sp. EXF-8845]|nr:hypothetical protein E4T44_07455 [Aureobasidium sp. EXF-8845]KAI4846140.1 hypothetical protein E4T45_07387 [Aureobasidium sp. EXF-8846]